MKNIFAKVYNEKDLNNLKRLITKDESLYADILKVRSALNEKQRWTSTKTIVKKIFNLEKKAHERGKTKTPTNSELLVYFQERLKDGREEISEERKKEIEQLLKRLKVRSNSGVTVVSLLTKPYPCPGRCIYCPTEARMPKSYLSKEPAAARALANNFDPYKQMTSRLEALEMNGHPTNKLEVIVIGGTFDYYKKDYQEWFIKEIFRAANDFKTPTSGASPKEGLQSEAPESKENPLLGRGQGEVREKTLSQLQKQNETAECRIIGLSTETRPDYINFETLNWLRYLGVTKIEIGVQHLDQYVLDFNKREMTRESIAEATEMMRSAGFKFVYHMMPNLPESNPEMDVKMFRDLYNTKDFHPDMLKIYPCVILKTSLLYKMFTKKVYKDPLTKELVNFDYEPYSDEILIKVLSDSEREIKNYTRLIRMIRDIPATYILASSKKSNMRELVDEYQKKSGFIQQDIRAREIRDTEVDDKDFDLRVTKYETNFGTEYFLEYISTPSPLRGASPGEAELQKEQTEGSPSQWEGGLRSKTEGVSKLAGFVRLRLQSDHFDSELEKYENLKVLTNKTALIRELHVYGTVKKFGEEGNQSQHVGFGKRLMAEAEKISKEQGYKKIAVISGVGVREYYKKLGYHLEGTYMVKSL